MPTTIYVTNQLKEFTEDYLLKNDPLIEHGGMFYGKNNQLMIPRFYPNVSPHKHRQYQMPTHYKRYLEIDKKMFGLNFIVHFHTHPSHSVLSGQDIKVATEGHYTPINILIAYDKEKITFTWTAYNKTEQQYIEFVDKQYEIFKRFFANEIGLLNLGSCFITEKGEVLIRDDLGKAVIDIDMDTLNLYKYVKKYREKNPYSELAIKKILEDVNLTRTRFDKAKKKLIKNKLWPFNVQERRKY